MRHGETVLVDRLVAEEEQVEVDRARPPVLARPQPTEAALDAEQMLEEPPCGQAGLDLGRRIEERG
jgi:hypothetical protein